MNTPGVETSEKFRTSLEQRTLAALKTGDRNAAVDQVSQIRKYCGYVSPELLGRFDDGEIDDVKTDRDGYSEFR